MKTTRSHWVVLVTVPSLEVGRKIARQALTARAAACVNILPKLESHYWWKGKMESATEGLLIFKTARRQLAGLERLVRTHHPYQTPEFITLAIGAGSDSYLDWILENVGETPRATRASRKE